MRVGRALVAMAAVVATAGVILLPATQGHADGSCSSGATLVVHAPDGSVRPFTAAELCGSGTASVNAQYYTRDPGKNQKIQSSPYVSAGVPIEHFLQTEFASSLNGRSISFIHLEDPIGDTATWTASQAAQPTYPDNSHLVPVVEYDGNTLQYVQPLLDDPSDTNAAADAVQAQNGQLQLYFGTGSLLSVTIAPKSTKKLQAGKSLTFTATSSPASSTTSYAWDFGDGGTATGSTVSHTYASGAGPSSSYNIQVTATDQPDGSIGQGTYFLTVDNKTGTPTSPPSTPTPTPTVTHTTPAGGSSSPPVSTSPPRPGSGRPKGGHGTGSPHPHRTTRHHRRHTHKPTPTLTTPPGINLRLPGAAVAGSPRVRAPLLAPLTKRRQVALRLAADNQPIVSGQLVGSAASLTREQALALEQTAITPSAKLSADARIAAVGGATVVILLLLTAGIAREAFGWRPGRRVRDLVIRR